jgi:adenylate cyclase
MKFTKVWFARLYILAVLAGFLALTFLLHLPHGPQHWSADLTTAHFSQRPGVQDKRIALVLISDATLSAAKIPYLSPIDRGLLARVVQTVDKAGAKVIGLDIILDRHTELDKDEKLRQAIQTANATVVVAAIDEPPSSPRVQSDFFFSKAEGRRPEVGHAYFDEHHSPTQVSGHVVRLMAEPSQVNSDRKSFAETLAQAAGEHFRPASHYISWLLPPKDGTENFLTLSAEDVLGLGSVKLPVDDLLHNKIVIVGGNFDDRDQHLTPLSVGTDRHFTGASIHAQILAQLLDHRSLRELGLVAQGLLALIAALTGYWLGQRSGHNHLWLELATVAGFVVIGILSFRYLDVIFPYNAVLIACLAGGTMGHYAKIKWKAVPPKPNATRDAI